MAAYVLVDVDVTDTDQYDQYRPLAAASVEQYGGRYIVRGSGGTFLEGGWPAQPSALVSRWPSRAAALAFWNSPEYAAAKRLREGTGRFRVLLVDSPEPPG